jgi:hypothetical protein
MYMYIDIYIHTYIHTYIRMYIHIYTYIYESIYIGGGSGSRADAVSESDGAADVDLHLGRYATVGPILLRLFGLTYADVC